MTRDRGTGRGNAAGRTSAAVAPRAKRNQVTQAGREKTHSHSLIAAQRRDRQRFRGAPQFRRSLDIGARPAIDAIKCRARGASFQTPAENVSAGASLAAARSGRVAGVSLVARFSMMRGAMHLGWFAG